MKSLSNSLNRFQFLILVFVYKHTFGGGGAVAVELSSSTKSLNAAISSSFSTIIHTSCGRNNK